MEKAKVSIKKVLNTLEATRNHYTDAAAAYNAMTCVIPLAVLILGNLRHMDYQDAVSPGYPDTAEICSEYIYSEKAW